METRRRHNGGSKRFTGYEVKRLNEQVKRNISRFPEDFMFQLTMEEVILVKSQFATSPKYAFFEGQDGGRRKLPYAFTEQGIYMLATVLRGELAEQQSIFIMRTFREMRHYIKQNQQFVTQAELNVVTSKVSELSAKVAGLEEKQKQTELQINTLNENFITEKDIKNYLRKRRSSACSSRLILEAALRSFFFFIYFAFLTFIMFPVAITNGTKNTSRNIGNSHKPKICPIMPNTAGTPVAPI